MIHSLVFAASSFGFFLGIFGVRHEVGTVTAIHIAVTAVLQVVVIAAAVVVHTVKGHDAITLPSCRAHIAQTGMQFIVVFDSFFHGVSPRTIVALQFLSPRERFAGSW